MATATKETKKVLQPPVYKDVDDGITLRLDRKEAVVLRALVRSIGGCKYTSVRKQTQAIEDALESAKVLVIDDASRTLFGASYVGANPTEYSGKKLDEILARTDANASLVQANKAMGQAIPAPVKDIYAEAAEQYIGRPKRYVGFGGVFATDFGDAGFGCQIKNYVKY